MERTFTIAQNADCPVCSYPLTSSWHLAGCEMSKVQVREVHPPEWASPQRWAREMEARELFPLASLAHELKSPLAVMLGYGDMLRGGQLGPVTETQREVLGTMQDSGERLQRLIKNVLRLCELRREKSRSEVATDATAVTEAAEPSEVNQQLRMIFDHWKPVAGKKSIRYEFMSAAGSCWVQMNPVDLHLAVSNLIDNALKFTPERGSVLVMVRGCHWEPLQAQTPLPFEKEAFEKEGRSAGKVQNAVQIDVRDSGPGVPSEHRQTIFQDFARLPGAQAGNGLGLAIARRLVVSHGGTVWCEAGDPKGSNFSIVLPTIVLPTAVLPSVSNPMSDPPLPAQRKPASLSSSR